MRYIVYDHSGFIFYEGTEQVEAEKAAYNLVGWLTEVGETKQGLTDTIIVRATPIHSSVETITEEE